jgi:hypothetical protein
MEAFIAKHAGRVRNFVCEPVGSQSVGQKKSVLELDRHLGLRPYGTTGLDRNIGVVTKRPKVAEPPSSRGLALAAPEPHTKEAGHGGA